jgi:hypothetical protein
MLGHPFGVPQLVTRLGQGRVCLSILRQMRNRSERVGSNGSPTGLGRGAVKPRALAVVGMHRGGTATVARCLSLLGASLPRTPLPRERDGEIQWAGSAPIVDLHEELLASVGSSWDDVLPFPEPWYGSPEAAECRRRMVRVVDAEYAGSQLFVVNDPRICRLIPFWVGVLDDLDLRPAFVLPIRHPFGVAHSLERHHRIPAGKGLLVWLRHVLDAERYTRNYPRAFVAHDDILRDWRGVTQAIAEAIELSWPVSAHEAEVRLDGFLSPDQRHHASMPSAVDRRTDAVQWVEEAYELLLAACRSGGSPDPSALDALGATWAHADLVYRPVLGESRLRASSLERGLDFANRQLTARSREFFEMKEALEGRISTLENDLEEADRKIAYLSKQLTSIRDSTSWRMTKPLRTAQARVRGVRRRQ